MQDVGLGKMIEMLLHMERQKHRQEKPSLVLCPAAVALTWIQEAQRRHLSARCMDDQVSKR